MTISESVLVQARAIAAQPGFQNEPRHQIGKTPYFLASAPEHATGFEKKGNLTLKSGEGVVEYPIVFIPRTC
jgi:hypothetical protein